MALTGTDRGTGGNNSASTSLVCSPTSTIAVLSCGVLVIASDNAGSAGSTLIGPATITDSVGNVWIKRIDTVRDPGAASAGAELIIYTCESLTTQLTSSNNVTVNWSGSVSVTAKAYTFIEITPTDSTMTLSYVTGNTVAGSTANPTITTSSITSGDCVIGGGAVEGSAGSWTGDTDTTNGSWSAQQTAGFGTTTSGMCVTSQQKIVTGTATQTYNPALAALDNVIGWIQLTEVSRITYSNLESMFRGMNRGMGPS